MHARSTCRKYITLSTIHKMSPRRPERVGESHQSFYASSDVDQSSSSRQNQHVTYPACQVDSWRSYRDDTTNLQQMAGFGAMASCDPTSIQWSQWLPNKHVFNPAATPFQPKILTRTQSSVQSHFTPYQPLRISNGQQEMLNIYQARFNSTVAKDAGHERYALRSRGSANQTASSQDLLLTSIERQHMSSVPVNTAFRSGNQVNARRVVSRESPSATPPPAPTPTEQYLAQASQAIEPLAVPQKLLVVVDLNGTLLKRSLTSRTSFVLRPGVTNLMDYLLANHVVMIYTSSRPENAQAMVDKLLSPKQRAQLAAVWARDKLDLNQAQYFAKVQTYKKLERIWADTNIQNKAPDGRKWDQSNTILIDDSHVKALAQPYNLLRVEEFRNDRPRSNEVDGRIESPAHLQALTVWSLAQQRIIDDLRTKLEELKFTSDVSQLIRMWQKSEVKQQAVVNDQDLGPDQVQLLTPKSPDPQATLGTENNDDHDYMEEETDQGSVQEAYEHPTGYDGYVSDRSVSPIDESVWKDMLGGIEKSDNEPPTPRSIDN